MSDSLNNMVKSMYYDYEIHVGGKKLDEYRKSKIQEITFEDTAKGSDMLTLTVADPDFLFIDDDIFVEDTPVKFLGGWLGDTLTFEGYISIIDVDFPSEGFPIITVHCMDNSHIMNRKPKKRTWKNLKDSDIISSIFKEYGLIAIVDDTGKVNKTVSQSNVTDIQFIVGKVDDQLTDFVCYVEGNTGYFVKKKILDSPQDTLAYRKGDGRLLSFRARVDKESKQVEIDQSNIDLDKQEVTDKTTNSDKRDLQGKNTTGYEFIINKGWVKK